MRAKRLSGVTIHPYIRMEEYNRARSESSSGARFRAPRDHDIIDKALLWVLEF
jgi:hypothetical protein